MPGTVRRKYKFIYKGNELLNLIPVISYANSIVTNQGMISVNASSIEALPLQPIADNTMQILDIWVDEEDEGKVNVNTNGNAVDSPLSPLVILSGDNINGVNLENTATSAVNVYWSLISE